MEWAAALAGPLRGATCLWQDLDGLHVSPPPAEVPLTSILWAWRDDGQLVRVRLDEAEALVAMCPPGSAAAAETVPWATGPDGDKRVAGLRVAPGARLPAGTAFEQVVVAGGGDGTGAVTFVRPSVSGAASSGPGA